MTSDPVLTLSSAIERTWANDEGVMDICIRVLKFVASPPSKSHLSLGLIRKSIGLNPDERRVDFAKAIQYLLGDEAPVLELYFEVIDDEGNPVRLDTDSAVAAQQSGVHPLTGEKVDGVESLLLPFFQPGRALVQ